MNLTSASEAERHADRLRRDLVGTLDRIADNLTPANLASDALAATRAHTPAWLKRYWAFAQSPAGLSVIGGAAALSVGGLFAARRKTRSRRR